MKLNIEVDLNSEEILLATEIIRTLRSLTEHVKVNYPLDSFRFLILKLKNVSELDSVSENVSKMFLEDESNFEHTFEAFLTSFTFVLFEKDIFFHPKSVFPYMQLLPRLPENIKSRTVSALMNKVLSHLTLPRPLSSPRSDFLLHAEALVLLMNMEYISTTDAMTTVKKMISKAETRLSGITILGKMVEICQNQILSNSDSSIISEIENLLNNITDDILKYDIEYIKKSLNLNSSLIPLPSLSPPLLHPPPHSFPSPSPSPALTTPSTLPTLSSLPSHSPHPALPTLPSPSLPSLPSTSLSITPSSLPPLPPPSPPSSSPPPPSLSPSLLLPSHTFNEVIESAQQVLQSVPQSTLLHPFKSYLGHKDVITALSYDSSSGILLSGSKDRMLLSWNAEGQIIQKEEIGNYYPFTMDAHPNHHSIFINAYVNDEYQHASLNSMSSCAPGIFYFSQNGQNFKNVSFLPMETKIISCIRSFGQGDDHAFLTGESILSSKMNDFFSSSTDHVCYYDVSSAMDFSLLRPLRRYTEHESIITCISSFSSHPHSFFSSSRDKTIRVWDKREAACVGMFGLSDPLGRVHAHKAMVTCMHAMDDHLLYSSSVDSTIRKWDHRMLSMSGCVPVCSVHLNNRPITKIMVCGDENLVASVTTSGLVLTKLEPSALPSRTPFHPSMSFSDARSVGRIHDLQWNDERRMLYAAGEDGRVDVYRIA